MALEWNERFRIGEENTDKEHQQWFGLANDFLEAGEDVQSKLQAGESFFQHTRLHFLNEERMMREMQFPSIDAHIHEHEVLLSTLNQIMDLVGDDVLSKTELEEFVSYCLTKHISRFDASLEMFVKSTAAVAAAQTLDLQLPKEALLPPTIGMDAPT